jgi:hypothetical protein
VRQKRSDNPVSEILASTCVALWAAARACTEVDILSIIDRRKKKEKVKVRIYAAMLPFMRETTPRVVGCHWAGFVPFPGPKAPEVDNVSFRRRGGLPEISVAPGTQGGQGEVVVRWTAEIGSSGRLQ